MIKKALVAVVSTVVFQKDDYISEVIGADFKR